jgi:homoserine acetyltransferase
MKFPKYNYDDMVVADYRLITEHLKVKHMRLVMGTSMGAMHTWVWGEMYPDFMDALMPLASAPVEIAGRNRLLRLMIMDAIKSDPDWNNGNYEKQPRGLRAAQYAPVDDDFESDADAQAESDARESRRRVRDADGKRDAQRRERHVVSIRLFQRLQSRAESRKDQGSVDRD